MGSLKEERISPQLVRPLFAHHLQDLVHPFDADSNSSFIILRSQQLCIDILTLSVGQTHLTGESMTFETDHTCLIQVAHTITIATQYSLLRCLCAQTSQSTARQDRHSEHEPDATSMSTRKSSKMIDQMVNHKEFLHPDNRSNLISPTTK